MKTNRIKLARALGVSTLTALALFGAGCASIVHGGPRTITVNSKPEGARVLIVKVGTGDSVHSGTTPFTVSLSPKRGYFKGQSYIVRLDLAGYQPAEVALRAEMSGWYLGNIVFGGLIGMLAVDPVTGAMWNLTPNKIEQGLTENQTALIRNGEGFLVVLESQLTDGERANMVRVN